MLVADDQVVFPSHLALHQLQAVTLLPVCGFLGEIEYRFVFEFRQHDLFLTSALYIALAGIRASGD